MTMTKEEQLFKELSKEFLPFWRYASYTFEACYHYLKSEYQYKKIPFDEEVLLDLINDRWRGVTICMLELLRDFYYEVFGDSYELLGIDESNYSALFPLDLLEDLAGMKENLEKGDIFQKAKDRVELKQDQVPIFKKNRK